MQLLSCKMPRYKFSIYAISDTHIGSQLTYEKGRKEIYKKVRLTDDAYLVHLGDITEAIAVDDKRFDPKVTKMNPAKQYMFAEEELKPLAEKGKVLTVLQGTHDYRWCRIWGDRVEEMCERLKIPYGTFSSKLKLTVRDNLICRIFISHGNRTVKSIAQEPVMKEAYQRSQIKRYLMDLAGDCLIQMVAHSHKLWVQPPIPTLYFTDDGTEEVAKYTEQGSEDIYIHPDHRWYVNTGSLVKSRGIGFSSYAERKGLPPTDLGYARLDFEDKQLVGIKEIKF